MYYNIFTKVGTSVESASTNKTNRKSTLYEVHATAVYADKVMFYYQMAPAQYYSQY